MPFVVRYHASDFSDEIIRRNGEIKFYAYELVHAVFTTGRTPGDQLSYGEASVWEFLHRAALVRAYIRQDDAGHLVLSRLASELDRSEKAAVSYVIGQAMTGIFCRKGLSVSYLMHVDRYGSRWGMQFSSKKRADLFGYGSLGWLVAEAKGRSSPPDERLRANLRAQKSSVVSIQGRPPDLAMGCVSYFSNDGPTWSTSSTYSPTPWLKLEAFDPVSEVEPVSIESDMDRFILTYYEPFIVLLDGGQGGEMVEVEGDDIYVSTHLQNLRMTIGLLRSIVELVHSAKLHGNVAGLADFVFEALGQAGSNLAFPDGTIFEVDWQESIQFNDWLA